jgi:predicted deacylase
MMLIDIPHKIIQGRQLGSRLLITGGVHGDEYEPMVAIRRLIEVIDPEELCGCVTLVPVINEPAFALRQRCGPDNLDLARTCPGDVAGSITQRIAATFSALIRETDYLIDLHTGGTIMRVLPMSGYILHPDASVLDVQRRMARAFNLPIIYGTTSKLEGRSTSIARDAKVPAIYSEHGGGGMCDKTGVEAYVTGCLNVMAELEMIEPRRFTAVVNHIVEDNRAGSGHMQICNPSPMAGCFEPAVTLGDRIEAGQTLGVLTDPTRLQPMTVTSNESGIVLTLRTCPRVEKGDMLAVILETEQADE